MITFIKIHSVLMSCHTWLKNGSKEGIIQMQLTLSRVQWAELPHYRRCGKFVCGKITAVNLNAVNAVNAVKNNQIFTEKRPLLCINHIKKWTKSRFLGYFLLN